MSWIFIILFLSLRFCSLSESGHHKKHPSAVVVGTVYCDICFQQDVSRNSHFIPGASVLVQCKDGNLKESFRKEVKTDEHGEFQVDLPFTVNRYVKRIKRCSVKLINSSEPYCAVASSATSSSLHLKSRKEGIHIFSAGFFTFKPLKQPILCNQKPSVHDSRVLNNRKASIGRSDNIAFPPPLQNPKAPEFPPLPFLPPLPPLPQLPQLPQLPPLPPLLGVPNSSSSPGKGIQSPEQRRTQPENFFPPVFPPNPLRPPPLVPSIPLQASAPLPPPNSLRPPPAPLNPSPPIPGLTRSPTPSPSFPIPLPPFHFPRRPFPGFPPASTP